MTTSWPYPSFGSAAWLSGGPDDPALAAVRQAVVDTVDAVAPGPNSDRLLLALSVLTAMAERVDWAMLAVVGEARAGGTAWTVIGDALGVTKQAAHKRFSPYVLEALEQAHASA